MKNVLGTGVEVRRGDVRSWLAEVVPAYVAHAGSVLWVTAAARARSIGWLVLAATVFALATIVLDATLRRQRRLQGDVAVLLRVGVAAAQLAVGVWLLEVVAGEAWHFLAITSLLLVASTALSELRYSIAWRHTRGPVVLAVAALLLVLGLWPIAAIASVAGVALAGFGVATAAVGGELVTEDWLRTVPRWSPRAMHRLGASLLIAAALALVWAGGEPVYILAMLAAVVVAVAAVASDSDSGEVIVLLTIALFWAAAPRDVATVRLVDPQPGEAFFVALGDSYISGEGAEHFFDGTNERRRNECRRAPTAHPVVLADRGGPAIPDRVLFLACSGALAVDLHGDRPGRSEPVAQLDQYRAALTRLDEQDLAFVLLSIGGNDAGFAEVAQACVGPGDCSEIGARWLDRLDDVKAELDVAYDEVDLAFDVPIHVLPYPMPLADHGCWWSWLGDDEVHFLTGFVRELNDVVTSVATEHGFDVVETMESAFEAGDLRICDRDSPKHLGMNFIAMNPTSGALSDVVNPSNWIHNSFHPNEVGHETIARLLQEWITSAPTPPAAAPPDDPSSLVEPCDGYARPAVCTQTTEEWEGIQLRTLSRLAVVPFGVAVVGAWFLVAPAVRWAGVHGISLGRYVLGALSRLARRSRGVASAR